MKPLVTSGLSNDSEMVTLSPVVMLAGEVGVNTAGLATGEASSVINPSTRKHIMMQETQGYPYEKSCQFCSGNHCVTSITHSACSIPNVTRKVDGRELSGVGIMSGSPLLMATEILPRTDDDNTETCSTQSLQGTYAT